MSWRLFTWWVAVKLFSAFMFFLSSRFYTADENSEVADDKQNELEDSEDDAKDTVVVESSAVNRLAHI